MNHEEDFPCDHCTADLPISACSGYLLDNTCVQITHASECGVLILGTCQRDGLVGPLYCDETETETPCERKTCASITP